MKVVWAQDNKLEENPSGGAERTSATFAQTCPYELKVVTPNTLVKEEDLKADLLITSSIKYFSRQQIEWMLNCPIQIRYERDYWNLVDPSHEQYKKELWEKCLMSIFCSPAHIQSYSKLYPTITFPNPLAQPSAIDVDSIKSSPVKDTKTIWVGAVAIHKGCLDALAWCLTNNVKLHIYGTYDGGEYCKKVFAHPKAICEGVKPYEDMLIIFSRSARFIHVPVWVEPFGRVAVEARLSGCNLVLNEKVGATSYSWWSKSDDEVREILKAECHKFWERF